MPPSDADDADDANTIKAAMTDVSRLGLLQAGEPEPRFVESYIDFPVHDEYPDHTKIYHPATQPPDGSPLFIHIFGGGFIAGDCDVLTPMCRA